MKYLFAALDMLFFEIIIKFNWSNISSISYENISSSYETENWNYYDNIEHITNNKKNPNITLITKGELLEF
ncbi:hypothetical protein H8356DRAFT_1350061 [Neocallimastix lanati (nom. inval.)]|nr:hypothetical protein H8356DRAFT_1350061 [Neocallimastix sp. JGI-2020a]